jgi:hypothetical protein
VPVSFSLATLLSGDAVLPQARNADIYLDALAVSSRRAFLRDERLSLGSHRLMSNH